MPQKQKRMAKHTEESEKKTGKNSKRSAQIAYAAMNKPSEMEEESGPKRKKMASTPAARKSARGNSAKKSSRTKEQSIH